jgi:hypothetical protein
LDCGNPLALFRHEGKIKTGASFSASARSKRTNRIQTDITSSCGFASGCHA